MVLAESSSTKTRPNFPIKPGKLFINNEFRDGIEGQTTEVIDPATESVLTQVVEASAADAEAAIEAAHQAFTSGPWPETHD